MEPYFLCMEKPIAFASNSMNASLALRLYLITDDAARSPVELADIIMKAIDGGVTAVQFREKNCGPTVCAQGFDAVSKVCAERGVPLFLNADLLGRIELPDSAISVHYSNRTLPVHPCSRVQFAGYSAHGPEDAASAFSHRVDFCTLSPIFPTPSKAGILDPVGIDSIKAAREALPDDVLVALGGVNESNAGDCIAAGASGVAVIRAIMTAKDPARAARKLRQIVENCLQE
jgi:thiamine-phosphate pyrophosphorylase